MTIGSDTETAIAVLDADHPDAAEFVRAALTNPEGLSGMGLALYRGGPGCAPCALPARSSEWL